MQCALQLIGANNSIPLQWQNFQHEFPDIKNDGEFWRIGPDHTHTAVDLCKAAGFGVDTAYFDAILARVQAVPDGSNTVIGTYMCQGKMPPSVRTISTACGRRCCVREPREKRKERYVVRICSALGRVRGADVHSC